MAVQAQISEFIDHHSPAVREKICRLFFRNPPTQYVNGEPFVDPNLRPYLTYYARQCELALHDGVASSVSHQDVLDVINLLTTTMTKEDIKHALACRPGFPTAIEIHNDIIHLAARSILMMNVGNFRGTIAGRRGLAWKDGCLKDYTHQHFHQPVQLGNEGVRLEKTFTAQNLCLIAGLKLSFTNNLADHLRLSQEDKVVEIFHQASFLEYHRQSPLYPDGLVGETFRTLALLFPQSDRSTETWFRRESVTQNADIDSRILRCGWCRTDDRQIENFQFWHDRLIMLKQVYDEARPSTISQWWYDRRNGVQWYTFWVAAVVLLMTLFFGLVQSIEGALQVYKAYHPSPQ